MSTKPKPVPLPVFLVGIAVSLVVGFTIGYVLRMPNKDPMTAERALVEVMLSFDTLDTAAGTGTQDGHIGRCDIESALDNRDLKSQLRAACEFIKENPALFNEVSKNGGFLTKPLIQEVLLRRAETPEVPIAR